MRSSLRVRSGEVLERSRAVNARPGLRRRARPSVHAVSTRRRTAGLPREVGVRPLAEAYHLPRRVAANLVAHGLVLPVLEGWDEIAPFLPDGVPDPAAPRARAAQDRLPTGTGGGSVRMWPDR